MTLTTSLFGMFGPSPIKPLQTHMAKACACAMELLPFFDAVLAEDWDKAKLFHEQVTLLEREADQIKKELRLHLPKNLFLPVPRSDLLEMLILQDAIANRAKNIAGLVSGRKMIFPHDLKASFLQLLKRSLDAASQAEQAIDELDGLLESGFRGNEVKIVEEMIVTLDNIERDTDDIKSSLCQTLFKLENKLPPINAIFLYKTIEWTGELADHAHRVGGQLQLLLAR
jgi:predicted phosphate transport protein (TIGR00153 family)